MQAGILGPTMWTELLFVGQRELLAGLGERYRGDLLDFMDDKLPKLLGVALIAWL